MRRFDGPLWRFLGSVVGWFGFVLSFTLLDLSAGVVMGLGGFCASGGPYVIETECPDAVVAFTPLSIFAMLIFVGVGVYFSRGFGMPLVAWAWPILFVGLGVQFLLSGLQGDITGIVLAVFFIIMGLVPLGIALRASPAPVFVGTVALSGRPFADVSTTSRLVNAMGTRDDIEPVTTTPADWALSIGIALVGSAAGIWLAVTWFHAVAAAAGPQ